jgi:hypothetical protein
MILRNWGATPDEIDSPMPGDDLCPNATLIATRSILLKAPPVAVFPWLRQMGFGRAGWYSHDLLDNLGRRSARRIHPEWQSVATGDLIPAGPTSFVAAFVEEPSCFVLATPDVGAASRRVHFTLAYDLRPIPEGTRLVTRVRARLAFPTGRLLERLVLGPGDGIMVRRQLLTLARRVDGEVTKPD